MDLIETIVDLQDQLQKLPPLPTWINLTMWALLIFLLLTVPRRRRKARRDRPMTDSEKERRILSDAITEAVENCRMRALLSDRTLNKFYRKCADRLGLEDLRPKSYVYRISKEKIAWLKEQIKRRTNGGPAKVKPYPIPEPSSVVVALRPVMKKKLKRTA